MEGGPQGSLPLLFDALLFVAPGVHVEVEVVPVVAGREGDGLAQREAHGVDDPLPARLARAHAHRGGAAGGAQQVGRGEVMELPVVQDALPDGMAELLRDLEAHQILQGKVEGLAGEPQGKLSSRSEHNLWATKHHQSCQNPGGHDAQQEKPLLLEVVVHSGTGICGQQAAMVYFKVAQNTCSCKTW